tara:strand:- start:4875 stop:5405 length:531 start_codon:yes stop_codon:yes gene_type:complete
MNTLYNVNSAPAETPTFFINIAKKNNLKIYRKTWDETDGLNQKHHMYGYTQFSVRPYKLSYGCDGTTDKNIHFIAYFAFSNLGICYKELYNLAYPERGKEDFDSFSEYIDHVLCDSFIKKTTIVPTVFNQDIFTKIMHDLYEINYRSLVDVCISKLYEFNIDANEFWNKVKKYQHN